MKIQFTVSKCTETKEGKHVLTMKYTEQVIFFGQPKDIVRTVHVGGMKNAVPLGTVIEEDTNNFRIKEYPTAMITDDQGNVSFMDVEMAVKNGIEHKAIDLKWLHVKTALDRV